MRELLATALPEVVVVEGTAEAIPLADATVDAVTIAQAFHWFDPEPALAEIHRVLRPGGLVALVWNVRDKSHPVHQRYAEVDPRIPRRRLPGDAGPREPSRGLTALQLGTRSMRFGTSRCSTPTASSRALGP